MVLNPNEPPPYPPERVAKNFVKTLGLPPQFHAVWIRNEWNGDDIKHIIMFGMRRLPKHIIPPAIPPTFEGFEVRKVKLAPDGTPQVPLTLVSPTGTAPKYGR